MAAPVNNWGYDYKTITGFAGADLSSSEFLCVKQASDEEFVLAGAGEACFGVVVAAGNTSLPDAAGEPVAIAYEGIVPIQAGAAISAPGQVEVDGDGKVIALNAGIAIGWALNGAAADGDIVRVKLY